MEVSLKLGPSCDRVVLVTGASLDVRGRKEPRITPTLVLG